MDLGLPGLEVGGLLRQDAVGAWHAARLDGAPRCVRILRADLAERDDARLLFGEEIRRIARIDHPALIRVQHVHAAPPRPWILCDSLDGPSLQQVVTERGALPAERALALARRLASGFRYLEDRRQVHVAPLPERVVEVEGDWRLQTFRDIRAWDEVKTLKGKGNPDPAFAPPERGRNHPEPLRPHPLVAWALGSLLRFAAGGGPPRAADGRPAALPADFPSDLATMVGRLTDDHPGRRLQGPRAIDALLRGESPAGGVAGDVPRPRIQAPVPRRRKRRP